MLLRRFTSYLLITSYIVQSCLPAFAMENIDRVVEQSKTLQQGAVPALLDFKAHPEQTAACCFFYALDGENVKALVGLRDDQDTWCYSGGKSEKEDKDLSYTGSNEGGQESLLIYCPQPDVLRNKPFVDVLSTKSTKTSQNPLPYLTRTYFVEQEFVKAAVFNERLAHPELLKLPKSSLEFRKLQWVLVKDILHTIESGKKTVSMSDTGEVITLFEPMIQTLSNATSINLLRHLVDNKTIPTFPKKNNPVFRNKLHMVGYPSIQHAVKLGWELPKFDESALAQKATELKKANLTSLIPAQVVRKEGINSFEDRVLSPATTELIDFDQDAFGQKSGIRLFGNEKQSVPYDYNRNRIIMGKSLAAKVAANLELEGLQNEPQSAQKKRDQLEKLKKLDATYFENNKIDYKIKDSYHTVTLEQAYALDCFRSSPVLDLSTTTTPTNTTPTATHLVPDVTQPTLSDLLLQYQLGSGYIQPDNPYSPQSRLEANVKNLKLYHSKYSGDNSREMKRKSEPCDTDYEQLARLFELIKQHPGWLPIHHASQADVKFFGISSTSLFELLFLNPYVKGTTPVMRATDLYFQGHSTIAESINSSGTHDYQNGNMNRRLCGNMCITSGITTTHTSSNSVEYYCNSHSVAMPSLPKKYQESVELLGMVGTTFLPYQSIYEQFYGAVNDKLPNSAWTIVFVKPEALDTHAYPSHGGGSVFHVDNPQHGDHSGDIIPSARALYERAEQELSSAVKFISPELAQSTNPLPKKAQSVAEIRVTLHPELMRDSSKTKVISTDRFPIGEVKQRKLKNMLTACQINDVGQWLSSHNKLIPNSLDLGDLKELPIKKFYALVHQGLTGKPVEETLSLEAFKHLIRNGQAEGAQQLYEVFPDLLSRVSTTPRELVSLAVASGDVDTLKLLVEKVLDTKVSQLFSKDDIIALVMACIYGRRCYPTHEYVLQNFDLSTIDQSVRREWAKNFLPLATAEAIEIFHKTVHPITPDVIEDAVRASAKLTNHSWKGLTQFKDISKAELAEIFLKHIQSDNSNQPDYFIISALLNLLSSGLSYSEQLPRSGNPLLFSLPYIFNSAEGKEAINVISTLVSDENLLDYRNREGLSLLPYIQRRLMTEGASITWVFLQNILEKQITVRKKTSKPVECYGPFQQEFGDMELDRLSLAFSCNNSEFNSWRLELASARKTNSLSKILATWAKVPQPDYLNFYRATDPYLYLINKREALGKKTELTLETYPKVLAYQSMIKDCILEDNYSRLFLIIDKACEDGFGTAISSELGNLNGIVQIQANRKKKSIPFYELPGLLTKPEEFERALVDGQIEQKDFVAIGYAIKDEHVEITRKALPILFKNPSELVTTTSHEMGLLHWALQDPNNKKLLKCLLEYGGCFNLLSKLSEKDFTNFLHSATDEMLGWVSSQSPEIFAFCDQTRNFLEVSLKHNRFTNLDFFKANLKQLKGTFNAQGIPLVFCADGEGYLPVLMQVIQHDPSILKLTTKDGTPVTKLFEHFFPPDSDDYEMGKEFLRKLGIDL